MCSPRFSLLVVFVIVLVSENFPQVMSSRTTNSPQGNPNVGAQISSQNPSNSSSECWLTTEFKKKRLLPCISEYLVLPEWWLTLVLFLAFVLGTYYEEWRSTEEREKLKDLETKLQDAEEECKNFKFKAENGNSVLQALFQDISKLNAELEDVRFQISNFVQYSNLECNVTKDLGSVSQVVPCAKPQMSTCADSVLAGQSTSEEPIALMALCTANHDSAQHGVTSPGQTLAFTCTADSAKRPNNAHPKEGRKGNNIKEEKNCKIGRAHV